ncbi:gpsA [Wigglesworthia glossinidia endosymbiont of Glossina brevipalpis]|uniref:Glycerol-3-phosphate dehydrogenase [NAD(P)+] n=1 Tax=Wigglesworthia glossinidia brevipalpis TaxID=36870 RepID=GPDA_WIGBR|nr:RecName: Full=Glycerol-3-phosphate dehydrogenase [NAD(P)+]; AltName: Full=NAD(P)H-dependent glycerol-3-phosphate dehydrogenase [Wigglesworthia glossinidia endosymbiont of Glossina brevipalpis]BAC24685.1 gpsA [Wigglesworthia glossinidia endosymbiont of Glossina brevipalpis]
MSNFSITVIGAGAYGTALAVSFSKKNRKVFLWGRNKKHMQSLKKDRCNKKFLPKINFPNDLKIEISLKKAIKYSNTIVIAVPSIGFKNILIKIQPFLNKNVFLICGTKGLEPRTGRLLQEVVYDILGRETCLSIISGPSFARYLAIGLPTSMVLANNCIKTCKFLANKLKNKFLNIYSISDLVGVQIGGVIKNVIAIASGMSDGIQMGPNAKTAIITYGLEEMYKLGKVMGANEYTFMGMSGVGDLVLTCTDDESRNRKFGILLAQGYSIENAKSKVGCIIEGYNNIKEILILSCKHKINMPIIKQVYKILYMHQPVKKSILNIFLNKK